MKAIICTKYGPPEVLQAVNIPTPSPKDNEILVETYATTVTAGDCVVRSFNMPKGFKLLGRLAIGFSKPRNQILGAELSGKIIELGKNVRKFNIGDDVIVYRNKKYGGYAEFCCIAEDEIIQLKPKELTYEQAAAVPFGAITALHFLKKAGIEKDMKVLINGASGSVGTYAVQIAHFFGAEVTGVCSSQNVGLVQSLGAKKIIDYNRTNFTRLDETYDIIFDAAGKTKFSGCRNILKKNGKYIHTVMVFSGIKRLWYSFTGKEIIGGEARVSQEDFTELMSLLKSKVIQPILDRNYTLDQIVQAHQYVDTGRKKGNVTITIKSPKFSGHQK